MARWPAPGRCKRRLAAASGARRAAAIQARLTTHTLAAAQQLQPKWPVELVLAVDGLGGRAARRWGRTLGAARVRLQGRGSLGVRLQRQRQCARADGARAVVIVGSDLPELAAADLEAAFASLERVPLVLGPARDGGYWLIGLSGPALAAPAGPGATLFTGQDRAVAWGSGEVLAQTLAAAQAAGLGWRLLAERGDLDRPEDLEAWR
jgi:rSAM/selenodomain-associated transferase 1